MMNFLNSPTLNCVLIACVFAFLAVFFRSRNSTPRRRGRTVGTEKAYNVRNCKTGQIIQVGARARSLALHTGDYQDLGPNHDAATRYTGATATGSFDGTIPAGHVLDDMVYEDDRLNS